MHVGSSCGVYAKDNCDSIAIFVERVGGRDFCFESGGRRLTIVDGHRRAPGAAVDCSALPLCFRLQNTNPAQEAVHHTGCHLHRHRAHSCERRKAGAIKVRQPCAARNLCGRQLSVVAQRPFNDVPSFCARGRSKKRPSKPKIVKVSVAEIAGKNVLPLPAAKETQQAGLFTEGASYKLPYDIFWEHKNGVLSVRYRTLHVPVHATVQQAFTLSCTGPWCKNKIKAQLPVGCI